MGEKSTIALAFFPVVAINLKSFHVAAAKVIFFPGNKKPFFDFYCLCRYYFVVFTLEIFIVKYETSL
jgi:hypothetical protein